MEVRKEINGDTAILHASGRIDTNTSGAFQQELVPVCTEQDNVTVDFGDVAYISSAGLRVLLMGVKEMDKKDKRLKLTNVSDDIKEIFEVTGFDEFMDIS